MKNCGNNFLKWLKLITIFQLLQGSTLAAGQVYAVNSLTGSVLILSGLSIYSPMLALFSFFGAALGSITGKIFMFFYDEV